MQYKSHFTALRKATQSKELQEWIALFEESEQIQSDADAMIHALTWIGNTANELRELDIRDRARGIRDYIRNGG